MVLNSETEAFARPKTTHSYYVMSNFNISFLAHLKCSTTEIFDYIVLA